MRLTKFTDYSIRVLIHAATNRDRLVTIDEVAEANAISRAHVKKAVLMLSQRGYLHGQRGRSGGFSLAREPEAINLGALIRLTEPDFVLVECMGPDNQCALMDLCALPPMLSEALAAFVAVFDRHTLADAIRAGRAV